MAMCCNLRALRGNYFRLSPTVIVAVPLRAYHSNAHRYSIAHIPPILKLHAKKLRKSKGIVCRQQLQSTECKGEGCRVKGDNTSGSLLWHEDVVTLQEKREGMGKRGKKTCQIQAGGMGVELQELLFFWEERRNDGRDGMQRVSGSGSRAPLRRERPGQAGSWDGEGSLEMEHWKFIRVE
ncbi:hypothetical protein BT63DRAFT_409497 [Microthyrium microscopicum]|uniref:Uncharacterized protein n=1 Tax=Microthyrium microscopicum TaxID=703497 RepID=A0A6A6UVE7_9PEZI|nr:hypothetical protein BT63DRAFT_409497 [Microthyrium microscopicum]